MTVIRFPNGSDELKPTEATHGLYVELDNAVLEVGYAIPANTDEGDQGFMLQFFEHGPEIPKETAILLAPREAMDGDAWTTRSSDPKT